ncbi:MAG: ABC transporter permease [Anaerolineaceae bacterium]|nr:ABC transporter permease [Anaerolineaceae bacterium]
MPHAPRRDLLVDGWFRLVRNKAAVASMVVIVLFILVAIFADVIAPMSPLKMHQENTFMPPAWVKDGPTGKSGEMRFLLGTDTLGRDVLSRTIYGARVSMVVGFLPTIIILIVGTIIGLYSGYKGGWIDNSLMRLTDIIYAFPDMLFFIIVMISLRDTFIGQALNGLILLFAALALVNWVGDARIVRGQVLSLKEKEFVEAARCIGATDSRIMFRHLLPNSLGPIIITAAMTIPGMIITEAILGYLGLGLRPSSNPADVFITSWGSLLLDGQVSINANPWVLLAPSICVSLVVLAFSFLGDGLRDALDPRMQGTQ